MGEEYDFAHELQDIPWRLVEQMQPQPFRTFRTEFHMSSASEHTSTYTTTTHYSKQYIQSTRTENGTTIKISDQKHSKHNSDETDRITNGRPPDKHTTRTQIIQEVPQTWGTSMQFTEIKSLKRVHKVNEGIGTEPISDMAGIINPYTGEHMTIKDAILERILDVRSGRIIASPDGTQVTIEEAKRRGIIDPKVADKLQSPCGINEDGRELTLLEAIQKDIFDAEHGFTDGSEKRQKVTHSMTINQAIDDGRVDVNSGTYRLETGETIDIQEAYKRGYLLQHTEVKLQTGALSLTDIITQGLIDDVTGWIIDRNSGNKYQIDAAAKCNILENDLREIVDPKIDSKVTVIQALERGILNPKLGKFVSGHEKLSLLEAKRRQLIVKPKTLKEVVDDNLIDDEGKILSPLHLSRLTLLEAANRGVLDVDQIKSILDFRTSDLITLNEALKEGIILPDSKFRNLVTGETLAIQDAVSRGYIISVVRKSIFDVDGFQPPDKSDHISFNAACAKGFISKKQNGSLLVNKKSGKLITFAEGVQTGEVKPEVYEMLTRNIGIFENERELTVLEAVFNGYIDPKTGNLLDIKTSKVVYLNEAIAQHLITPEGASTLNSLLNLNVSTKVTRTLVQRYVTVTSKDIKQETITYTDALRLGLINNELQTFTDPTTKETIPIVQAISEGKLAPDVESSEMVISPQKAPCSTVITIVSKKETPIYREQVQTKTGDFILSEKRSSEKQVYELPSDGWSLQDAINQKLFDPVTGLFIIPGTDRLASFEECVQLKLISSHSAIVIDPISQRRLSINKALGKKIVDSTGHYKIDGKKLTLKEAIEQGYILFENVTQKDQAAQRLLQITKSEGEPPKVEVSTVLDKNPPVYTEVHISETGTTEPVQVLPGVIYDPSTNVVVYPEKNEALDLIQAVQKNKLPAETVKVTDPFTGKTMDIKEAIRRNIIDPEKGQYTDKVGQKMSLKDAAKFGIVCVVGAPIAAATSLVKTIKTLHIVHPKTGEKLPVEQALKEGLIDLATYEKMQAELDNKDIPGTGSQTTLTLTHSVVKITDPNTGKTYTSQEALEQGLITPQQLEEIEKQNKDSTKIKVLDTTTISLDNDDGPSEAEKTRARITIEPTYKVKIGRAQSLSPEREAKKVVLQKLRRRIVRPEDAEKKGLVESDAAILLTDKNTFIGPTGETLTLQEALESKGLDGDMGVIIDPQRGDQLTINEAVSRGILDPDSSNEILVPINRSLSIPEVIKQGLIDTETQKVIHPETGAHLSISEAIVCDIVDPLSTLREKTGDKLTLGEALESGVVDDETSVVVTKDGSKNLQEAVEAQVFDDVKIKGPLDLPPAGMTLPVAIKRGLVDIEKKELVHPVTKEPIPLSDAIKDNLIMTLPFPVASHAVKIEKALDSKLIDVNAGTFKEPQSGEVVPITEAIEKGLLIVKEPTSIISESPSAPVTTVTETVNTIHTVTTKTIEILSGYAMLNKDEVQNIETGQIIPIEEAKAQGIIKDVKETKNKTVFKDIHMSFSDALNKGLVDMNKGTFTDPQSGESITIQQAIQDGKISATPQISEECREASVTTTKTSELNISEAFETIYDEKTQRFIDVAGDKQEITFQEALNKEIIDPNSIIYDVTSQKPVTIEQAVERGLIDSKTGKIKDEKSGKSIDFKEATKKGLIAVLGGLALPVVAPVVAGVAAVNAVKEYAEKKKAENKISTVEVDSSTELIKHEAKVQLPQHKTSTVHIITKEESISSPDIVQILPIGDAISQKLIEPKICRIIYASKELPYTIQDGLDQGKVSPLDEVQVITNHRVILIDVHKTAIITISRHLTAQKLCELGYYDMRKRMFMDPQTGAHITFEELVYDLGVIDPDTILVKDLTSKPPTYISLHEALEKPLLDRQTGYMVDRKTGKKVPFFEAVKLRWIIHADDKPKEKFKPLTLQEIANTDNFDPVKVEVKTDKENVPLIKALNSNLVDPKSVTIRDSKNMQLVPYYEAIDKQIVDPQRGLVLNTATQKNISFTEAFLTGLVLAIPRPISLQAVLHKDMYDTETLKIKDPLTKQYLTVKESIERHIVDDKISEIKDVQENTYITLEDAISKNIIESGQIKNTKSGQLVPLDQALDQQMIRTKSLVFNLLQVILANYYSPQTGLILNPITGDEITLAKAIEYKLVDPVTTRIKDDRRSRIVEIHEAIEQKLIDSEKGLLTNPPLTLDQAYLKGYILSTVLPWSLQETLAQNVYDSTTGQIIFNDSNVTISQAIEGGIVNPNVLTVKDPKSGDIITLNEAIKAKLIDPIKGQAYDPTTNVEMNLVEAQERGLIVPYKTQITLPEAVFKGFYDPATGKFINPKNKERLKASSAINRGYVDASGTLVTIDEEVVTFEQAVSDGIIDTNEGIIMSYNEPVDFNEAFERGLLVEIRPPVPLSEAIVKGLYDEESQLFLDPQTGQYLTLIEAIEICLIDAESVSVKDTRVGIWRKIPLIDAIHNNYIDGNTGQVKDFSKGEGYEVSLQKAFDLGILVDNKAALTLQRAIHQGLYDENTGKILDPSTDRKVTLHEAIRNFNINPLLPCYFDRHQGMLYNLSETCRLGIIDKRNGTFKDPNTDKVLKLSEALNQGLMVDIETANFGLSEALEMGFYIPEEGLFVHPSTGRKYNLKEAIENELINPVNSIVKNSKLNKYVQLTVAIETKIIDEQLSIYVYPHGKTINLLEAKNKGLVVTGRTPITLEEALHNCLYRPESGKIADPMNNEFYDLRQALANNFIDSHSTAFKDLVSNTTKPLPLAIEEGRIDVDKGRVLDSKSKKTYNFDEAFKKGILVTLRKPFEVDFVQASAAQSAASPTRQLRECSLDEAVKFELLNPEVSVVRDLQTGNFKSVADALKDGQLEVTKTIIFDVQSGKIKSLIVTYDQSVIIFLKEPLSFKQAIDMGYLDINTGKFKVPDSEDEITFKESITLGFIDPDSALIKDVSKKKLIKLPEGFRKGLIDAEKGNVLDSSTSKLYTLSAALDSGLLVTTQSGFTLIESVTYGIYNPTTGCFNDPFVTTNIIDRKKLTLTEAVAQNLIDPSSTVVKDLEKGVIMPLLQGVESGIVDAQVGRVRDVTEKKDYDFAKALEKGLILPAEQRQAVEEKYKLCDETLSKLLHWIGEVEDRIASQDVIHEVEEDLRNQINIMKQIRDDLEQHAGQVSHCGDQVRQLVLTAGDILSKSEVSALEKSGRNLKTRFDKAIDKTEKLLRRQLAARDELGKLKGELNIFSTWLGKARRTLEDKERALSDLQRLDASTDSTREFVSDVIAHQADLRFITMSAQKFVDEGKEYLIILNDFRTSLPSRLPHIEPISSQDSPVRSEVSLVTQQYRDLLHRANNLSDRLSGVGGRQRDYSDALDKARSWLRDAEPRANKLLNEPIGGDPKTVEDQLHKAKSLNNEFVANGKLIDNAKDATSALVRSLEGQISPSEIHRLEEPVQNIENKYNQLSGAIANRCQELDTALIQSQGVQDALDGIIDWLNQAENQFKNMQRPASLIQERLDEQLREHRVFQSDIDTHISSIDSVYLSANELIVSTSNARVAKQIEGKLNDVKNRFEKLFDRVQNRGVLLAEVNRDLVAFNNQAAKFEKWYSEIMEIIESRELAKAPAEQYALQMKEISRNRDDNRALFEEVVGIGKELLNKRDVTDTSNVRDRVKSMESQWRDLENLMEEKTKLSKLRAEQHSAYETLKEQVLDWLTTMETKVARLDIVAIHLDTLRQQNDELKPITSEYKGYSSVIDKINDIGTAYDNLSRGDRPDSPSRRKGYSPTKRPMSGRRSSQDARSPSPTKGLSPLSTGGSSGFSSRRSSQDGFHLEELSPVQQQLSEINNRYSFLGVKINDRQSEIDSIRDELKKQLDNLKTLSSFLEKIHRQMPKDSVPNTKEEADKLNKQIKHVLEEMYEKQSLLDTTTSQVRDLLKRKAGAIGADNLNDELEEVLSHWKSINDYLKNRIKFMEDMKEFHDTHDSLNSWLGAKERMLTVLGPISSDSRMVQSQVQQVQVLREEFRSQQPQLQHLLDVGDDVLSYLEPRSSDHQKIDNKLTAIQQKWADILGKLDERADSLGAAADTSREFDAQLTRLKDALQGISDNLDEVSFEKDPEEQLRKVENLERQLEGQRPLLADLEANGAQLCEVLSDPASRADIQSKLASIGRQYNALQKKLDLKKAEIEGSLRDGRQFEASCAKTLGWLSDELGSLTERLLISADRDVLEQQLVNHEPIYRDVLAREHEVIMLLNKGREMVSRSTKADTRAVQRDLDKIQQSWEKLRKEAVDRQTRLKTCQEHCRKYYTTLESFLPWLRQAEDKIDSLRLQSFEKKHIEKQLRELQAFRNEVWKKSGEYENTRSLGETFLSSCDIDKEIVKNELQELKERWDKLNNDLILRTQALEDQSRKLGDFNENLRDLKHGLERCEDKLASHDALGGASRDPKLLDRIKALREETAGLKKPLQALKNQAEDLCHEAAENGIDANQLKDDVDSIGDRINDLQSKLNDRCLDLQSAATAVTQFNDKVKGLSHDLSALETELDNMKAPGRDIKTVRGQLDDVARFISKVAKAHNDVEDTILAGERLVDSGFAPDTAQTRQQVDALKRQLGKLDDRAHNREQELESALKKLEDFYIGHAEVLDGVKEASEQLRKLKPIGSDVEGIRAQQKDFKKFRASTVEPLNKSVETCNRFGQGLIQSAASGVNTQILEKDLEKMNDQWNTLKEKINDRERKLDIALLQSGKFQEALDGLSKWLADTEELVANQKAPSADYKVVKAQLQEQKFLKKMLLDRQNSMSSLFTMGNEIAKEAEPSERKAIEKQLKDLIGRFDALTEGAQQRTLDLEHAMKVAKEFQDKLTPLQDWLERSEKKVRDMELIPTDEEKIQQRIKEHTALHNDILSKKPDFRDLADVASNLMNLVGDDEAATLADKLTEVTDRYGNLVDASENIRQLLEASRKGLRTLVLTYQDLAGWMDAMEQRLARYKVLAVHTDRLLEQMDDLVGLTEDIVGRQKDIDDTVDAGIELMRHISSDEALQLKDKLDSLQRRYNDLTSRGNDLLKNAQALLPLVQKFHNNHNRLVEWMQGAESILQSAEPNEGEIARLEVDLQELRPVLETINVLGPQLCQASPGEGAATIEGLVSRDNRRFDAIAEQIQRRAERIHLGKQRALEVTGDIDELLEWFREVEAQIKDAEKPSAEPDLIRVQLKEHKALNDDISSQKGRVRDVLSTAKKVLRESPPSEDTSLIREKMEDLREAMDNVSALSSDRLGILEQALPLAEHFNDTHIGLLNWLGDIEQEVSMLTMPALRPEAIQQQQDKNEMLVKSIHEHKPLVDKLNKTGEALIRLCNEDDGSKVQEILDSDNARYAALKLELRERERALEQAMQESSQFSDKLEGMLRALTNTADQVNNQEPISAHVPKIRDQIDDNDAIVSDLNKRKEAYAAVQRAADDVITKAGNRADPAVKDIRHKLDRLKKLWDDVQRATKDRGHSLDDALDAAQKFWKELHAIMATLKDLEDSLVSQEPPAVEPKAIQEQQVALQEIRQEIDQTKPEVDQVRSSGKKLMKLCGEPDKPEVKKHIEDLDNAWDNITALYAKREENLIDAMEKAMEFHETLQDILAFLDKAEKKFDKMGPLGADIDAVKRQIDQLKAFKAEVDPHMVKVEALNRSLIRQAQELTERTSADQAASIKEPLSTVNRRWDDLLRGMVERQRQLENALLRLGQFQHALNELLVWISKTDKTLDELKPVAGDAQTLEIELAKLKVLINDIQAHQTSVDTLNDAGRQIIESGEDRHEASATQEKLNTLNTQWRALVQKAADRQRELEDALSEAHSFNQEVQDLLAWLGDVDNAVAASKPVGGLPETASEQLERFMEVYNEIEDNRPKVETVLAQGQEYLKKAPANSASNLQHNLRTLKQRWDSVTARANDKKIKLEIALKEATEFHESLQAFVDWLTNAEKILTNLKPVSRVLDTVQHQIEEHKIFQKDVSAHREIMLALDKKGTHLKYFSQKQDVILIKNLLISVQHRWERVASKSAERTRALDLGYKEAKEFHDSWAGLMNWLEDTEQNLEDLMNDTAGNDPEKIKARLAKHTEFQRALSGKQATYDAVMKSGKNLKDKAPKFDENTLKQMLQDLKNKWTSVCNKSRERQQKLEEALLYSGQFKDAVAALLEWLKKAEKELSQDSPVHGDLDTVTHLIDIHRQFEKELEQRNDQMESVMRSGQELERTASKQDAAHIRHQLTDLTQLWESVTGLTHLKTDRLHDALKEAEKLHKSVNMILDWLSDAEMKLRFVGNAPEDESAAYEQLKALDEFRAQLNEKEIEKDQTLNLAHNILAKAHPDSINVIKNWIKVIKSRWEEVSQWALQRHQKISAHMQSLRDMDETLEELIQWLLGLENTLIALKKEELPMDISATEQLIADHKEFMENTQRRQAEVDKVCKAKQVKIVQPGKDPRKFGKGKGPIRGSQHDLHETSSEHGTLGRKQSFKGSRDLLSQRGSRVSPGRELSPDPGYPHIGPRFPPAGSEPEFRSPRVKFLYDKWRHVWVLSWERQRELYDHLAYLKEKEKADNFSWDDWRKRFLKFMNYKKSRLTDLFRKMDKDNNELIPREDFIDGIIKTKFDTSRLEMKHVADMFDENNRGLIDWKKFIAALRPDWEEKAPDHDAQKIHDEVKRLVMLCTCRQKFRVFQVGEGKYRFGDSQKLRLVRILRSTVMVRVGGGWVALDEFLLKNDPCRAKGRTNIELREQFILADGVSQTMTAFKSKRSSASPVSGSSSSSLRTPQGPITKVRERSQRSVPMGSLPRTSKSSLSAGTPDSLSDNESGFRTPRKPSYRSNLTPGGSRSNSRPASRTGSRPGSKPPSRHGSNLSLDSTDDTPSRIPRRTPTTSGRSSATLSSARKTAVNGTGSRPRTPSGLRSPASPALRSANISRASSIPTLTGITPSSSRSRIPIYRGNSKDEPETSLSTSSSCSVSLSSGGKSTASKSKIPLIKRSASSGKVRQVTIGVAPTLRTASRTRTPSGSNTPVHPEQATAVSRLLRKNSGASETPTGQARRKKISIEEREPFRL
ncbi:microtubule-actin cross-linking factor 1 isoform X22 [Anthonomus grandis grandis]|uniref:microtubule-actin cross-linking factor 1 isoform X22 n=1 Tax=Anthonomus grandis grandis TaxID=2921223 RepID=UPI0021654A99|nr:microtubule-actin cross-linking factor 1 isoform X22 [Anthonomus grandis grandis]